MAHLVPSGHVHIRSDKCLERIKYHQIRMDLRNNIGNKRTINLAVIGEKPVRASLAIPGIILHLILVPGVMLALGRTGLVPFEKKDA